MTRLLVGMIVASVALGTAEAAGPEPADVKAVVDKAVEFLKTRQNEDGSFVPRLGGPGITAMVAAGLLRNGVRPDDPVLAKALRYLEKQVQPDGGIYNRRLANYTTCVALVVFKEANKNGKYDQVIANAGKFLKSLQGDPGAESDTKFGGVGYDGKGRPDLSNTSFFVESLLAAGVSKDDPAVKNAMKFISRCQNLPGETNDRPYAKKTTADDKGGLTYNPADADNEKSPNRTPVGGLRSIGSMTYAGLKSFVYAGLSKDDPRVKAALDWIARHYTLDQNPARALRDCTTTIIFSPRPWTPMARAPSPRTTASTTGARISSRRLRNAKKPTEAGRTKTPRFWRALPNSRPLSRSCR